MTTTYIVACSNFSKSYTKEYTNKVDALSYYDRACIKWEYVRLSESTIIESTKFGKTRTTTVNTVLFVNCEELQHLYPTSSIRDHTTIRKKSTPKRK